MSPVAGRKPSVSKCDGSPIEAGFPADTLAQLTAASDKLASTIGEKASYKGRRVQSTEGIAEKTKRGSEAVRTLSSVIERQFAKDRPFLAAWRSAKRVVAKPGLPRGSAAASVAPAVAPTVGAGA